MPSVSIITPCFNAAPFLSGTVQSVLRQGFTDWEHILVDDGSTDDSLAIARSAADRDPRFRVFSLPHGGTALSRNAGFSRAAAESRYLMFLDADDILEPHAISTLQRYLEQHPQVGLVYGSFSVIDSAGDTIFPAEGSEWWPNRYVPTRFGIRELDRLTPDAPLATLVSCNRALQGATLLRRSVFARTQGWDETLLEGSEDDDMVLQMAILLQLNAAVRTCTQGAWLEGAHHARAGLKKLSAYALLNAGIAGPVLGSGGRRQASSRNKRWFLACH